MRENVTKKIFLIFYARKNFGDDLFVKMLLEKYPKVQFFTTIHDYKYLDYLDKYNNLHVMVGNEIDETGHELDNIDLKEYDGYVYIGGSIFMEGNTILSDKFSEFIERCRINKKPFYYISSNYETYVTKEFLELSKKAFTSCTDICFRDKYSYNIFKDINSVRYAPDYAFSYSIKEQSKIKNSIGISVINIKRKNGLVEKQKEYIQCLVNNIEQYISNGNKVYLYSFCKYEDDETTIDAVLEQYKDDENVVAVRYDGDIDKFLDIYGKMEYMICGRFHAMILSCIFEQKMFITSYSDKINNVINDLDLKLPIIHFNEIENEINIDKNNFVGFTKDQLNDIIKESKEQDRKFREFIEQD